MELFVFAAFLLFSSFVCAYFAPSAEKGSFEKGLLYVFAVVFFLFHIVALVGALGSYVNEYGRPPCEWLINETVSYHDGANTTTETHYYASTCEAEGSLLVEYLYAVYAWFMFFAFLITGGVLLKRMVARF